jgi:hypothetical protein
MNKDGMIMTSTAALKRTQRISSVNIKSFTLVDDNDDGAFSENAS